jgi:hypothetical protein
MRADKVVGIFMLKNSSSAPYVGYRQSIFSN